MVNGEQGIDVSFAAAFRSVIFGIIYGMDHEKDINENGRHEIGDAAEWVEDANLHSMLEAQDRFTREIGAELKENCNRLIIEVGKRCVQLENGKPPSPVGAFDREEIARILTAPAMIEYKGYVLDAAGDEGGESSGVRETTWETNAEEEWKRSALIGIYEMFLEKAEKFAEGHGAKSAMRDYGEAARIVKRTKTSYLRAALPPDDALRVIDLEQAATASLSGEMRGKGAAK